MGVVNTKFLENLTYTKNDEFLVDICIGIFVATLSYFILNGSIKRNFLLPANSGIKSKWAGED